MAYVLGRPGMIVRVESLQCQGDQVWEVARATGSPADIQGLADVLAGPPTAPIGAAGIVERDARSLRWVLRWDRPAPDAPPSLFHLVYDTAGPDALVAPRLANGRIEVRVSSRSCEDLRRLYARIEETYRTRWNVRLVRVGEPRAGPVNVADEDRALLARAIEEGYYDEPKRVGVRELGTRLGWSKTVISRKLRALERRAVELLASD